MTIKKAKEIAWLVKKLESLQQARLKLNGRLPNSDRVLLRQIEAIKEQIKGNEPELLKLLKVAVAHVDGLFYPDVKEKINSAIEKATS